MSKKYSWIAWLAAIGGAAYIVRKVFGLKSLANSVSFMPMFAGTPYVRTNELVIPFSIGINNPSSGSLKIGIDKVEAYLSGSLVTYADIPTQNTISITSNSYSVLKGFKLRIPLNTLLQVVSANVYDIVNGNLDAILSKVSIKFDALIGGALSVSVSHSFASTTTNGLGLVAARSRVISPLSEYSAYIPSQDNLKRSDLVVSVCASTEDTIKVMKRVISETLDDTKRLAKWLKRDTLKDTIESVWNFIYRYIQYQTDDVGIEQVRRPLRTLYDQKGDCDCYSTLIGSIFTNLGINYKIRIAKLYNRSYWQHVYIIVPYGTDGKYYVCDPVVDECFKECQATETKDF